MKKFKIVLSLFLLAILMSSCSTVTIPNSSEAIAKLEEMGYYVNHFIQYGDDVAHQGITQVTVVRANKGEDFLEVFFFANKEDTQTFYEMRAHTIVEGCEVIKKNKYSIYRGTEQAVSDFLG